MKNINEALVRIESFRDLQKGWDGEGDGEPISEATRQLAKRVAVTLPDSSNADGGWFISPTSSGEIWFESNKEIISVFSAP